MQPPHHAIALSTDTEKQIAASKVLIVPFIFYKPPFKGFQGPSMTTKGLTCKRMTLNNPKIKLFFFFVKYNVILCLTVFSEA